MTLRVALGAKMSPGQGKQIVIASPILGHLDMLKIREQNHTPHRRFEMLYPAEGDAQAMVDAMTALGDAVVAFAAEQGGIAVLTDRHVSHERATLPAIMVVGALNQRLIDAGLRLRVSLIVESGQIESSHHVAAALGFGASAVYPLSVQLRAEEKFAADPDAAFRRFAKAAEKSLMKTMGRVGLCTVESYIGGEFFEPNFLDTSDPVLRQWFPNMKSPVGGVGFNTVAVTSKQWHERASEVGGEKDLPLLGLFKERADGAGHSFGTTAVRKYVELTEEEDRVRQSLRNRTIRGSTSTAARTARRRLPPRRRGIPGDELRPADHRADRRLRHHRRVPGTFPLSWLRNDRVVPPRCAMSSPCPVIVTFAVTTAEFTDQISRFSVRGNKTIVMRGIRCESAADGRYTLSLDGPLADDTARVVALGDALSVAFADDVTIEATDPDLVLNATGIAAEFLSKLRVAPAGVPLSEVQSASDITPKLASGAMSHGALNAPAHEAVAHGTNMVGAMSNSGEGGEHLSRYNTIRASRIKQFASGRFGIWAGYLADPMLEEIEIKLGQGAKTR